MSIALHRSKQAACVRASTIAMVVGLLQGCSTIVSAPPPRAADLVTGPVGAKADAEWVDRLTWGADTASVAIFRKQGREAFLATQLRPGPAALPSDIDAQIASLKVARQTLRQLVVASEMQRKTADSIEDDVQKKAAQQEYQRGLTALANEAATRSVLRDLYSSNQLQEQMTWFWFNHFNVFLSKSNLRAMVGDYEERAIRPHALGKFCDLLTATMRHPAMLRYLDNEQNAVGHINENYARELLELHTLGVGGGYTQRDVQEVARVLTGMGLNLTEKAPKVRANLEVQYVRDGLFEFDPGRHDYGDKDVLGHHIKGRGLAEGEELAKILCGSPATAQFIGRKLALYFVGDDPTPELVDRMAAAFQSSDGDIAATLSTMFHSQEFVLSLGRKFKDPIHYAISAVRIAYDGQTIVSAAPVVGWLNRMGEPLFGRLTPDGYPLGQSSWASPGQMTTRFEIARIVGNSSAGLFRTTDAEPVDKPAFPQLATALYYDAVASTLSADTRLALRQSKSPQEWNLLLLASPEFMHR
jgi:uncharacterized protein (DUF1800 family)